MPLKIFIAAASIAAALSLAPTALFSQQIPALPVSSISSRPIAASDHSPMDAAIKLSRESLAHIQQNVDDYTALFVKRCRVDGQLPPLQYANIKIRNRKVQDGEAAIPFSVYLNFLKPASVQGREVIWVDGQNDGKLIAHENAGVGSLLNVKLDPNGMIAMRGQRYPITEIGIENLVSKIIETGLRHRPHGECEVQFFRDAKIGDVRCLMMQVTHPIKRDHFDFYQARVYFDEQLKVPIRYEAWSWPKTPGGQPVLEEEYMYLKLQVNVGLTDQDFDPSNPEYHFR